MTDLCSETIASQFREYIYVREVGSKRDLFYIGLVIV